MYDKYYILPQAITMNIVAAQSTDKKTLQKELDELRLITTDAACIRYARANMVEFMLIKELEARIAGMI